MKQKKIKRPSPIHLDDGIVLRVIRGPNEDGDWYWTVKYQMEDGKEGTHFSMWSNPGTLIPEFYRRKGLGLLEEKKSKKAPTTVEALADLWLESIEEDPSLSDTSKGKYRRASRHLKDSMGDIPLNQMNAGTLDDWRKKRLRSISDHTFNLEAQVLISIWKWGTKRGFTPFQDLAVRKVEKPKERDEKYTPSDAEVDLLWKHLSCQDWIKLALLVCRYTGARNGELDDLKWSGIDFQRETITLTGKTGTRTLPMFPELISALQEWKNNPGEKPNWKDNATDDNVFGRSHYVVRRYLNPALQAAAEAAGIEHRITVHSLRRWFISRLKRAGVDVRTAADWMGHSPAVMLAIYSETTEEDFKDALSRVRLLDSSCNSGK